MLLEGIKTMTVSEIESKIDSGLTMYISTCTKQIKITKKVLDNWRKAGVSLFKDDKDGHGFYIARGRQYDYVLERTVSVDFV